LVGGADIYAETNARQTILATASRWGRDNHVRGLLDAEADPNIPSTAGKTALHEASKYGWIRIVQMLLDAGADASKVDERGRNALTLALASGHEQVAQALWTVTSGMSRKEIYGKALIEASRHGMTTQGVVSLLKAGADALFVDEHGANALLGALENGFAGELIMRDLVEAVPDLPQRELYHVLLSSDLGCWPEETALVLLTAITDTLPDTTYREALTTASRWGYTEIVQKLLEMMPYVLREDVYHNALINAAKYDYIDIVQILLEAIIDIAPGEAHRTALIESVARGHVKIVQLLSKALTCGSSVDVYEEALIEASKAGRSEIVRSILAKSNAPHQQCIQQALIAAVSQPSYEGVINVHVIKTTRDRTVQILLDAGVDVNAPAGQYKSDSSGAAPEPRKKGHSLPLHAAAAFHRAVLVDMLLDAGADVHARDHNEDTALQVVSHQGCDCWSCKTIKQMLLAAGARQVP
jgi:ankyrin repeat protein